MRSPRTNTPEVIIRAAQLIVAGWQVIESDGTWLMTIQAPPDWDEPGDRELVINTQVQAARVAARRPYYHTPSPPGLQVVCPFCGEISPPAESPRLELTKRSSGEEEGR